MPNWITNKIKAAPAVISAMLNDSGRIDFKNVATFPGDHDWDGIYGDAETAAELVLNRPLNSNALIASLEGANRKNVDISKLNDESFEQFIGMLRNYRKCGYLHAMEFAREVWGTKWNACEPHHDIELGTAEFDTAWSCPRPVFEALSKRFPSEEIHVTFADEDIGSNCGTFVLKDGIVIQSDIAPSWRDMTKEMKDKWRAFACEVKGRNPLDYQDEE